VAGLQIWCSDCLPSGGIVVYSGSEWTNQAAVNSNLQAQITALLTKSLPSVIIGGSMAKYKFGCNDVQRQIHQVNDRSEWGDFKNRCLL
jgi:hypothetical protein